MRHFLLSFIALLCASAGLATEQPLLAKDGVTYGVAGSSANLAVSYPTATGAYDPAAHTNATRTGEYGVTTAGSEAIGWMIGALPALTMTHVGSVCNATFAPTTDNTFQTGYGKMGWVPGGTSTTFYVAQTSNYTSTGYLARQSSAGQSVFNALGGQALILATGSTARATITDTSATFASGVPVTINDTTASTTTGTGALIVAGGAGISGVLSSGGNMDGYSRTRSLGSSTSYATGTGACAMYRSGGTITTNAGDMVFQSDPAATRDFYFAAGATVANAASINGTNGTYSALIAGGGISIKSGSNARCGTATLVAGTVTVSNTSVTANTRIMVTVSTAGGTQGFLRTSKSVNTSFTVTSTSGTETSTVDWELIENP